MKYYILSIKCNILPTNSKICIYLLSNEGNMVLNKSNLLIAFIIFLSIAFALCQFQEQYLISAISKSLIVPLITLLYFINVQYKSTYFTWFLVLFSLSEISTFLQFYLNSTQALDAYYVIGNIAYIIAYTLLLLEVIKNLNFKRVFIKYKLQLFILGVLNIYIAYMLLTIVIPVINDSRLIYIEVVYNIVILLLLTFSLITYFYNDNKKTLLFFIGCLCIVFSEVIQIAYFYIAEMDMLNYTSTILFVLAFCFFYFHAKTNNVKSLNLVN